MKLATLATIVTILLGSVAPMQAKTYRIVVPTSAGSNHDVLARTIADKMNDNVDTFVIENVFGAGGDIALDKAVKYAKDKLPVIYFAFDDTFVWNEFNKPALSFDRIGALTFMAPTIVNDQTLLVRNGIGVRTIADLVKYAQSKTEPLLVGEVGELSIVTNYNFTKHNGIKSTVVRYRNVQEIQLALQRGEIDYSFQGYQPQFLHMEGFKMIATTHATRYAKYPEIPTFKEAGYPDLMGQSYHIWSVPKSEEAELAVLQPKIAKAIQDPAVQKLFETFMFNIDTEINSDQKFRDMVKARKETYKTMLDQGGK